MALFTVKPATVQKDVAATFTIDYAELATYSAVPAGYYKTTSNWHKVFVRMKHKYSNQKAMLEFTLPSTSADLLLTDAARAGDWELDHLMIRDFDKGEVLLRRADIPNVGDIDFIARSSATHGDIYVPAGGDVTIPSGGKRQYGDFVVEAGGVLRLADGGGITEIEVLETCLINGTIMANNGTHTGGTWNSTSVLGEALSHTVTQKAGGDGGEGEGVNSVVHVEDFEGTIGPWSNVGFAGTVAGTGSALRLDYNTGGQEPRGSSLGFATIPGVTYTVTGNITKVSGSGIAGTVIGAMDGNINTGAAFNSASFINSATYQATGAINFTFVATSTTSSITTQPSADFGVFDLEDIQVEGLTPGGQGGISSAGVREPATGANAAVVGTNGVSVGAGQAYWRWQGATNLATTPDTQTSVVIGAYTYFRDAYNTTSGPFDWYDIYRIENNVVSGNGGGGGRSFQFGALDGDDASETLAGQGAGQDDAAADEYGEDGADSLTASEAGNGGFRGAHGQGLYLKARKIQGTGTIEASGQKGGDGGDGAEYDSGGILYGNGAGGGGAGGDGGYVWLRHMIGTPALTVNVAGGAMGSRGLGGFGSAEAGHGVVGSNGTVDIDTFL